MVVKMKNMWLKKDGPLWKWMQGMGVETLFFMFVNHIRQDLVSYFNQGVNEYIQIMK